MPGVRRGGTGLGLPYARRLAAAARRRADADQRGRARDHRRAAACRTGRPSVGTVVLADDDAGFRQVLKSMLGRHRRPGHRGRGRRPGARRRRRRPRRPGARRPGHARHGRQRAARAGCLPRCPRSSSPASTCRRRRGPRRCCARTSSPGNGWRSPSARVMPGSAMMTELPADAAARRRRRGQALPPGDLAAAGGSHRDRGRHRAGGARHGSTRPNWSCST